MPHSTYTWGDCDCICHKNKALGCSDCLMEAGMEGQTDVRTGKKYDGGKPRMDLLSPIAMEEIAKVMTFGATKYGDNNWRAGLKWSRVLAALLRHTFAFLRGEDKDPETGLSHIAHAGCCIMFLLEYEKTCKELDDRYFQTYEEVKEGEQLEFNFKEPR